MRDLYAAERDRNFGIPVLEIPGWVQRGAEMGDIYGSGNHHTADANNGQAAPSTGIVTNGRGGPHPVPGPLANGLLGRDDFCRLIAAGRANHGGVGSFRGRSGNSHFWGLEIVYAGTMSGSKPAEAFPYRRFDLAARWHASRAYAFGYGPESVWQHFEYAEPKGRKIDLLRAALNLHGGTTAFLDLIEHYRANPPFKQLPMPKPQPPYKLDRVLRVGDRDRPGNAIVTRVENLLLLSAELRGHTGSRPGKADDGLYSTATAAAVEAFRSYWWDTYDLPRPRSQRHFAGPEGNMVGRKVYDALVFDVHAQIAALAA